MKGLQLLFAGAILGGSYNDESPGFNAKVCANSTAIANVLANDVDGLESCLGNNELYFSRPNKVCQEPCRATVVEACKRVVKECPGLGKGNKADAFSKVGTYRLWADKSNVDVMCKSLGNNNSTCLEDLFKAAADVQNAKAKTKQSKSSNYGNHDLTKEEIKRVCTPCTKDIYNAFQGKEDQAPGLYMLELIDPKQDIESIGEICGYDIFPAPKKETSQTNTEQTSTSQEATNTTETKASQESSQSPQYEEPSSQKESPQEPSQGESKQPSYNTSPQELSQGESKQPSYNTSPQEPSQGESKQPSYNTSPQEPSQGNPSYSPGSSNQKPSPNGSPYGPGNSNQQPQPGNGRPGYPGGYGPGYGPSYGRGYGPGYGRGHGRPGYGSPYGPGYGSPSYGPPQSRGYGGYPETQQRGYGGQRPSPYSDMQNVQHYFF